MAVRQSGVVSHSSPLWPELNVARWGLGGFDKSNVPRNVLDHLAQIWVSHQLGILWKMQGKKSRNDHTNYLRMPHGLSSRSLMPSGRSHQLVTVVTLKRRRKKAKNEAPLAVQLLLAGQALGVRP